MFVYLGPDSVPRSCIPSHYSASNSLALPQQAQEGELGPHLPGGGGGGGKADSGPVQGAGSLVQQPIEEQGKPAEGHVLRGPDHGMHVRTRHSYLCVFVCVH